MSGPLLDQLNSALAGTYTIERELGGGGMSHVFVATEIALGRRVVIKVLPPNLGVSLSVDRFKQEVRVAANFQHPHIVPVLTAGKANELLYYTMPYVQGESLRDRLQRDGRLPIPDVRDLVQDVLSALSYAHRQGIVHRDIKPENILLTPDGALVTDFGIAKATATSGPKPAHAATDSLTGTGVSIGTLNYMAPEQLAVDPTADQRVDLYAIGLVLYECLTGSLPFADLGPTHRLAAVMTETPPRVRQGRKDVPASLAAVVDRCLAREREQRPSADEVLAALSATAAIRRSSRRGAIVGATVAVALLVATGWAVNGPLRAPLTTARRIVSRPDPTLHTNRILVAPFQVTPDTGSLAALGGMIADYVAQGLSALPNVEVVDSRTAMLTAEVVDRIPKILRTGDNAVALAEETGAGVLITGHVHRVGDSLIADAVVIDAATRRIRESLGTTTVASGAASALIDWARRRAVAAVTVASDTGVAAGYGAFSTPPSLEAYALSRVGLKQIIAWDTTAIHTLRDAVRREPAWVSPRLALVLALGNNLRFAAAESAIAGIRPLLERATAAERAMYAMHEATYRGDYQSSHAAAEQMMQLIPGSIEVQLLTAAHSLYDSRPRRSLEILANVDPDRGINLGSPFYWRNRAISFLRLGDARRALEAARAGRRAFDVPNFAQLEIQALADLRETDELMPKFDRYSTEEVDRSRSKHALGGIVTMRLLRAGAADDARRFGAHAVATLPPSAERTHLAAFLGDTAARREALTRLRADSAKARAPRPFEVGEFQYRLARLAILAGEKDRALRHLTASKAGGHLFYNIEGFRPHHDPLFASLHGDATFENLIAPKER
jgi:tRNA A-37 threonylcarbamoyl transferase component Bud32